MLHAFTWDISKQEKQRTISQKPVSYTHLDVYTRQGLSRGKAAETLAGFFGTRAEHTGGSYDAYAVRDAQGRVWKLVSDGSIQTQKKVRGQTVAADSTCLLYTSRCV